jgi:hypothetical protein
MKTKKTILNAFTPVRVTQDNSAQTVSVIGRDYQMDPIKGPLFSSIVSCGKELLASPIRLSGIENGDPVKWVDGICSRVSADDEKVAFCGSFASGKFVLNTSVTVEFDGCADISVTVVPKGQTVAQVFGLAKSDDAICRLDRLWLEIPLKKELFSLYHIYPNSPIIIGGKEVPQNRILCSNRIPEAGMGIPFKAFLWTGCEDLGLTFFAESNEGWQPQNPGTAIELIPEDDDVLLLRVHLLDSHPEHWVSGENQTDRYSFSPLSFRFGLQATPVKEYPKNPFIHNALHIDCFKKIEGDYLPFLKGEIEPGSGESGFDRIKRLGVDTLYLHEKWNEIQNSWILTKKSSDQLKEIIRECHDRGIKVIPYFGYEISTLSPLWDARHDEALSLTESGAHKGGWYRVPHQRAYIVCYNSSWGEDFVNGITKLINEYGFDGFYFDTLLTIQGCANTSHGCGWQDSDGNLHTTYPIWRVRELMRRIYEAVKSAGGIVNYHSTSCCNTPAMSFTDLCWNGEAMQFDLVKGEISRMPTDHLRAEFSGKNFGIPIEFIAYENKPVWTFDNAIAFSIVHGMLPRPNDISEPLEKMSVIWKIFEEFGVGESAFHPYWENGEQIQTDGNVIASYFERTEQNVRKRLIIAANALPDRTEKTSLRLKDIEPSTRVVITDKFSSEEFIADDGCLSIALDGFGYRIYEMTLYN